MKKNIVRVASNDWTMVFKEFKHNLSISAIKVIKFKGTLFSIKNTVKYSVGNVNYGTRTWDECNNKPF